MGELCRQFNGPRIKDFYKGVVQFINDAKKMESSIKFYSDLGEAHGDLPPVGVTFSIGTALTHCEQDTFYNTDDMTRIAAYHASLNPYEGMETLSGNGFMNNGKPNSSYTLEFR